MADPGEGALFMREVSAFEPEGDMHQGDQDRHLDQRADNRGECLA